MIGKSPASSQNVSASRPDALILSPVNHAASSEARNTTTGAISLGGAKRAPSGVAAAFRFSARAADKAAPIPWMRLERSHFACQLIHLDFPSTYEFYERTKSVFEILKLTFACLWRNGSQDLIQALGRRRMSKDRVAQHCAVVVSSLSLTLM